MVFCNQYSFFISDSLIVLISNLVPLNKLLLLHISVLLWIVACPRHLWPPPWRCLWPRTPAHSPLPPFAWSNTLTYTYIHIHTHTYTYIHIQVGRPTTSCAHWTATELFLRCCQLHVDLTFAVCGPWNDRHALGPFALILLCQSLEWPSRLARPDREPTFNYSIKTVPH